MVAKRATLSSGEVEALALAVLASTNLLRVGEEYTVRRKEQGVLDFFGVKNRVAWHVQPLGPWARRWPELLH